MQITPLPKILRVKLEGSSVNRDGIGAVVRANIDGNRLDQMIKTGSSYLSQSELAITIAAPGGKIDALEIAWPDGDIEEVKNFEVGSEILIRQGQGIVSKSTLGYQP